MFSFMRRLWFFKSEALEREALCAAQEAADLTGTLAGIREEAQQRNMDNIAMLAHQVRRASFRRQIVEEQKKAGGQ